MRVLLARRFRGNAEEDVAVEQSQQEEENSQQQQQPSDLILLEEQVETKKKKDIKKEKTKTTKLSSFSQQIDSSYISDSICDSYKDCTSKRQSKRLSPSPSSLSSRKRQATTPSNNINTFNNNTRRDQRNGNRKSSKEDEEEKEEENERSRVGTGKSTVTLSSTSTSSREKNFQAVQLTKKKNNSSCSNGNNNNGAYTSRRKKNNSIAEEAEKEVFKQEQEQIQSNLDRKPRAKTTAKAWNTITNTNSNTNSIHSSNLGRSHRVTSTAIATAINKVTSTSTSFNNRESNTTEPAQHTEEILSTATKAPAASTQKSREGKSNSISSSSSSSSMVSGGSRRNYPFSRRVDDDEEEFRWRYHHNQNHINHHFLHDRSNNIDGPLLVVEPQNDNSIDDDDNVRRRSELMQVQEFAENNPATARGDDTITGTAAAAVTSYLDNLTGTNNTTVNSSTARTNATTVSVSSPFAAVSRNNNYERERSMTTAVNNDPDPAASPILTSSASGNRNEYFNINIDRNNNDERNEVSDGVIFQQRQQSYSSSSQLPTSMAASKVPTRTAAAAATGTNLTERKGSSNKGSPLSSSTRAMVPLSSYSRGYDNNSNGNLSSERTECEFRAALKKRGLEIREQDGDGNCLFRAISLQVYGDPNMHFDVRKQCMDHMERDQEHFSQFVTGEPFLQYIARTRQDGVHGNNPEIQASSELFNRPIEVFTPENGASPLNIFHAEYKTGDVPIRLSYHDGNHYNAVIDPLMPTAGLGLGLPGLKPGLADKMQMAKAVAESDAVADQMELQKVMKSSEDDELQRAIKESQLSAEHMNSHAALSLSDMDATYFELEQAALERSLHSYGQNEHGKKQRASTTTSSNYNDHKAPAIPSACIENSAASLPCPSQESIPLAASVAFVPPAASVASASASASAKRGGSPPPQQGLLPVEDYPSSVQELVMNGFTLGAVVKAYDLVGNNFDDMLSLLLSNNTMSK